MSLSGTKRKATAAASSSSHKKQIKTPRLDSDGDEEFISDDGEDLMIRAANPNQEGDDDENSEDEDDEDDDDDDVVGGGDDGEGDEEEGESDEELMEGAETVTKVSDNVARTYEAKKGSSLYKPPTNEEIQLLQSTSNSKSNLFGLQLNALLESIRPNAPNSSVSPAAKALSSTLHALRTHILALPPLPAVNPSSIPSTSKVPFPSPPLPPDAKWTFKFDTPKDVRIGGSYILSTGLKPKKSKQQPVDVHVLLPESIFQEKDYLNNRVLYKRAFYLSVIAESLRANKKGVDVGEPTYSFENNDTRSPTILIHSTTAPTSTSNFTKTNLFIRIHAITPDGAFPASKLAPEKNSLRPPQSSIDAVPSTPMYNSFVLSTTLASAHLTHLHALSTFLPSFGDTMRLLSLWASKRPLLSHASFPVLTCGGSSPWDTFTGMVISFLIWGGRLGSESSSKNKEERGRLGRGMAPEQVFRGVMSFLAGTDLTSTPVFLRSPASATASFAESAGGEQFPGTFVEPEGKVNILAHVPRGVLVYLQSEATRCLRLLESLGSEETVFSTLWLNQVKIGEEWDIVLKLDLTTCKLLFPVPHERLDQPARLPFLRNKIEAVIRRALGTRARTVSVFSLSVIPDSSSEQDSPITFIGLVMNPSQATRLVDKGPPVEEKALCEDFQKFWGSEKSQLRRFKNNETLESVVWSVSVAEGRETIPYRSVEWIVKRHFGLDVDTLDGRTGWNALIKSPTSATDLISLTTTDDGVDPFRPTVLAFQEFSRLVKNLTNIPLDILNIFPVSSAVRYTSTFAPTPLDGDKLELAPDCLKYVPLLECVVQFESSGKWADDLEAIQKLKLAFFEAMGTAMANQVPGSLSRIALDDHYQDQQPDSTTAISDHASFEVFLPDLGFAFRVRIWHDREKTLLERLIEDTKNVRPSLRKAAKVALDLHELRFHHLPRHHQAISTIHHSFPNAFSPTVRLVKRWFSSHMLSIHVPDEMIELIVASVFVNPSRYALPSDGKSGFVRVISLLASEWDWKSSPLMVPVYSAAGVEAGGRIEFPKGKREEVWTSFTKASKLPDQGGKGFLFVATEEDLEGRAFGSRKITKLIAGRVVALAGATLAALDDGILSGPLSAQQLFQTPLQQYQLLIHLKPSVLPRSFESLNPDHSLWTSKYKNASILQNANSAYGKEMRFEFDPALMFVRELERIYADTAVFFYDQHGSNTIGALWNPSASEPRNFKVALPFSSKLVKGMEDKMLVVANEQAIVSEIGRLGEGLIEKVEVVGTKLA